MPQKKQYLVVEVVLPEGYEGDETTAFASLVKWGRFEKQGSSQRVDVAWSVAAGPYDSLAAVGESLFDVDAE